jgi:chromosomal replication initiator protein
MSLELDFHLTFDSYIVGTANRLATAAARRVAEAPGTAYNPLFLYGASGLGKTHLLTAIGNHIACVHPGLHVVYDTLEHLMEGVMAGIQAGERDAFRSRLQDASVLLLDDVQFLAGRRGAQDELLRAWDGLLSRGGQVVLASDRPPVEIDGLDQRLLSRFSGGLVADLSMPDYETRVAIVRKKADEYGQLLEPGVAEALARLAFGNVRELQGGLNRVLAVQELDGRPLPALEVLQLLGVTTSNPGGVRREELDSLLAAAGAATAEDTKEVTAAQVISDTIRRWQGEGFATARLEAALRAGVAREEAQRLVDEYTGAAARLVEIAACIRQLDGVAPELASPDVLRNPDRVHEAESILELVRERMRPLPQPPEYPTFEHLALDGGMLAVRAAQLIAEQPGDRYNPLFIHGPAGAGKSALATATALAFRERHAGTEVAYVSGEAFAAELIHVLERNQVESWRARYRRARLLVIDGVDSLMETERAQEELFHLFDGARRAGVQFVFTAATPPRLLHGLEERLRTRLEGGLVVELDEPPLWLAAAAAVDRLAAGAPDTTAAALAVTPHALQDAESVASTAARPAARRDPDDWFLDREKVIWHWPYIADGMVEELE